MCGIFGVLNFKETNVNLKALQESLNCIRHRGPDDEGYSLFNTYKNTSDDRFGDTSQLRKGSYILSDDGKTYNLALGFRRLSILDLSPNGHQPFFNDEKNVCIIFNGEVYNYIEIREELKALGYKFRTGTDTEVIVYSYMQWGEECLSRFNGMWGLAIYDMRKNVLFCTRDRFGVKPFYYYKDKNVFVFSSELKAILEYFKNDPSFKRESDPAILYDYFVNSYADHTENTFIKGIKHLQPSHYIRISGDDFSVRRYFSFEINKELTKYDDNVFTGLQKNFLELIHDSVKLRLRADVPIGTCLSGGLDSSTIVSIINKLLTTESGVNRDMIGDRQKTFSAVYKDAAIDESRFIEEVVKATNCSYHYVYPDRQDDSGNEFFIKDVGDFIYALDEPIISTSPYAQYNVMRLAGENKVTVLLDGQGGDETLGGYEVYFGFLYANLLKEGKYFDLGNELMRNFSKGMEITLRGLRYKKDLKNKNLKSAVSPYYNNDFLNRYSSNNVLQYRTSSSLNEKMYEDLTRYIIPILLRYEDRNAMRFSIESRTPFLDYRLVKMLFSTEATYKIHNGWSKWILRNAMKELVPEKVLWRRDKKGFPTPERKWMRILKDDFISSVTSEKDQLEGLFNTDMLIRDYDRIISDQNIKSHFLWKIYNFTKWMQIYGVKST